MLTSSATLFSPFEPRDLRCLRNTIHTHLLITYIMADLLWIVTATLQVRKLSDSLEIARSSINNNERRLLPLLLSYKQLYRGETNKGSCIIVIFLHYFHLTNFFWMFVEG